VVIFPLLFVGVHLLLSYWLCKTVPLRYALLGLAGLTVLFSLVWYGLSWVFAFGLGESMVLPEHRPLEWFRADVQFQQVMLGPLDQGLWPLPVTFFLLGVESLLLTRIKWGWVVLVAGLLLLSGGASLYANQPLRLSDVVAQAEDVPLYPGATGVRLRPRRGANGVRCPFERATRAIRCWPSIKCSRNSMIGSMMISIKASPTYYWLHPPA
jgi:hypothetical protein